jgi:hypothetical protein
LPIRRSVIRSIRAASLLLPADYALCHRSRMIFANIQVR